MVLRDEYEQICRCRRPANSAELMAADGLACLVLLVRQHFQITQTPVKEHFSVQVREPVQ